MSNHKFKQHRRILNCLPSPKQETDWTFDHAAEAGVMAAAAPVPKNKDLRADWWKVSNQKSTGSCVGWATADGVLRWHFVQTNRIAQDELLSVRYIWMASKESDEFTTRPTSFLEPTGTSLKAALDIARKFGVVTEEVLPFGSGKLADREEETFYALAARLKIASYFNLDLQLDQWRRWIAQDGPILARLEVDESFFDAAETQGMLTHYQGATPPSGHAVTIVGYTPEHFIIRNSWGDDWGDQGFAYATEEYIQAAFTEAYGITV
jgi:aminopeptidase C